MWVVNSCPKPLADVTNLMLNEAKVCNGVKCQWYCKMYPLGDRPHSMNRCLRRWTRYILITTVTKALRERKLFTAPSLQSIKQSSQALNSLVPTNVTNFSNSFSYPVGDPKHPQHVSNFPLCYVGPIQKMSWKRIILKCSKSFLVSCPPYPQKLCC